jgi:hypothetical protein
VLLKKSLVTIVSITALVAGGILTRAATMYGSAPAAGAELSKVTKPRPTHRPHGTKVRSTDPTITAAPSASTEPTPTVTAATTVPAPATATSTATTKATASATANSSITPSSITPTTSILDLPRIPWEGGPGYYKQFPRADASGWDDPTFFPISVFLGSPDTSVVASYKDAGVNTYLAVTHDPDIQPISNITSRGLFAIAQFEPENRAEDWTSAQVGEDNGVVGWFSTDECEMGYSDCLRHTLTPAECDTAFETNNTARTKLYLDLAECKSIAAQNAAECSPLDPAKYTNLDECHEFVYQRHLVNQLRAKNDGRFTAANFGNGLARSWWSPKAMDSHHQLVEFSSVDKYAYTSKGVGEVLAGVDGANVGSFDWPEGVTPARAAAYGFQADQFQRFQSADPSPVGVMIETGRPMLDIADCVTSGCNIKPEQMEGAVWSALIHEARHISYFSFNNNDNQCGTIYNCPVVHDKVKAINTKVQSLAPVLNTQSYYNDTYSNNGTVFHRYTFKNGTDAMLKVYNGSAYIFADLGFDLTGQDRNFCEQIDGKDACKNVGVPHTTGGKTFALPAGVNGTSVEVVGEGRTLSVDGSRQFTDSFTNEYTHHVYKISLT